MSACAPNLSTATLRSDWLTERNAAVVIVGAGQAGARVAVALRDAQHRGSVLLLGNEAHAPYERPALSKRLLTGLEGSDPDWVQPTGYYEDQQIDVRPSQTVVSIDREKSVVSLSDGTRIPYGALVIATGARPIRLSPLELGTVPVCYFRTLDDARALKIAAIPGFRVVIVGGGLIGLELAASLTERGCTVTIVEAHERVLARCLSHSAASSLARSHREHGVTIVTGRIVTSSRGPDGEGAAVLDDGTRVVADLLVVAVGVVPNVELGRDAGLAIDNGIVVDEHGRTDVPGIYAVGDVTFQSWRGLRLESWANANAQAEAAAGHIVGAPKPAIQPQWFWTDQYDLNVQVLGVAEGDELLRQAPGSRSWTIFHLRGNRLVGATAFNDGRTIAQIRRLLPSGDLVDPAVLADSALPLREAFVPSQPCIA